MGYSAHALYVYATTKPFTIASDLDTHVLPSSARPCRHMHSLPFLCMGHAFHVHSIKSWMMEIQMCAYIVKS